MIITALTCLLEALNKDILIENVEYGRHIEYLL